MATGDKSNSNLFGTNFNDDDKDKDKDKEKEAQLAAQNAIIGSPPIEGQNNELPAYGEILDSRALPFSNETKFPINERMGEGSPTGVEASNIPASAFGQAPAINPFSMEAAGQVNPMLRPQNLESFVQPQALTELPVEAVPNVASSDDASFISKLASIFYPPGSGGGGGAGLPPTFTPPSAGATQAQEGTDITPVTLESLGLESSGQRILKEAVSPSGITQAPSGVADLVETPSGGAQEQTAALDPTSDAAIVANRAQREAQFAMQGAPGSAQSNFATRMATGEALTPQEIQDAQSFAASMGTTFDPSTGYSREPFLSQEASRTSTPMPGQSLSQFMRYEDSPEQRTEQFVDDQGRLRRRFTPTAAQLRGEPVGSQPLADQYQSYESEVAKAQARLSERDIRPGETQAQRDTRIQRDQSIVSGQTGGQLSQADLRDLAQASMGDATEGQVARGLQIQQRAGLGQFEQDSTGGLTFDQQLALRKQNFAEGKFDYELAKDAQATYTAGIEASQKATTEEAQADTAGRTMVSAISNMNDAMTRMGGRSGEFFGSGFFGKAASFMPGTSAYDQVADVEFLQSNVALNAMSELKELSPTGSTGFGALSEKELRVLTDKYANLNPFTSPDLFQSNLKQLQGEFNNMLDNAWNKHSKEYSPEAASAIYGNRGSSGATGTPSQAVSNDRNVASAADTLLSDPKYN